MNVSTSVYTNVGLKFDMETAPLNSKYFKTDRMQSIKSLHVLFFLLYQLINA